MTEPTLTGKYETANIAHNLALKQVRINAIRDQIRRAEESLKKLQAYQTITELKEELDTVVEDARDVEKDLRKVALDVAIELQIKDPAPGITITKKTTFTIDDAPDALEACRENYPQLIEEKIKKPALKKIVIALGEAIDGTTLIIEEYGQVKIATDLSKHYPADEAPF